jgi:hypothetical protein
MLCQGIPPCAIYIYSVSMYGVYLYLTGRSAWQLRHGRKPRRRRHTALRLRAAQRRADWLRHALRCVCGTRCTPARHAIGLRCVRRGVYRGTVHVEHSLVLQPAIGRYVIDMNVSYGVCCTERVVRNRYCVHQSR